MNFLNICLNPGSTVAQAIRAINQSEAKFVLVVDTENRLLGTITDGDVRRALLNGSSLDSDIFDVMNRNPKHVRLGDSASFIRESFHRLNVRQLPVLDGNGVVCGVELIEKDLISRRRNNPVLIMAGGFGSRLKPLTNTVPKPMLRVGGAPILQRILEAFCRSGFHDFYISTHYKAESITDYFGNGSRWGVNINYLHEGTPLGTAGAISLLPPSISDLPLIISNGDVLTSIDYGAFLDFHVKQLVKATIGAKDYEVQVPYGVIVSRNERVEQILEKPIKKFLVNAGIYVLDPSIVRQSRGVKEYRAMTTLIDSIVSAGENVGIFPIHEYWVDIGRLEDYSRVQDDLSEVDGVSWTPRRPPGN